MWAGGIRPSRSLPFFTATGIVTEGASPEKLRVFLLFGMPSLLEGQTLAAAFHVSAPFKEEISQKGSSVLYFLNVNLQMFESDFFFFFFPWIRRM